MDISELARALVKRRNEKYGTDWVRENAKKATLASVVAAKKRRKNKSKSK